MSLADTLDVLFEDNHCIAVNKPSGWPTTHYDGGEETFDRVVKSYLKEKYDKPGNVFLGVVHRLDKPVSGVLVFARTSKAAARLSEQFRNGGIEKTYWAVVEPAPTRLAARGAQRHERAAPTPDLASAGTFEDWLSKDEARRIIETVSRDSDNAQHAITHYHIRTRHNSRLWLELRPQTGRKHQLRVQLSSRGFPIHGDTKYGSPHTFGHAIALHARSLTFLHPIRQEPVTLTAELPPGWRGPFARLLNQEGGR